MKPMLLKEFCNEMLDWVDDGCPQEDLMHCEIIGLCHHYEEFLRRRGKAFAIVGRELEKLRDLFDELYGSRSSPFNQGGVYYSTEVHKYENKERRAFLREYAK